MGDIQVNDTHRGSALLKALPRSGIYLVAIGAMLGLVLGVLARVAASLPEAFRSLAQVGGPWLALAFVIGAIGAGKLRAAVAGTATVSSAVLGYYGYMHFVEHQANAAYLAHYLTFWLVPAFVGGPLFGYAGAVWRTAHGQGRALAVGLLSAVLLGEGAWLSLRLLLGHRAPDLVLLAELLIGAALPLVLLRGGRQRLAAYTVMAGLGIICAGALVVIAVALTSMNRP